MSKVTWIRSIIFLIIFGLLFAYVAGVFHMKVDKTAEGAEEKYNDFYRAEKGMVEAVMIGTSAIDRGWIGPKAYHDYGLCVYDLSTARQPIPLARHIMKEVLRTQQPEVFIIDLRGVVVDEDMIAESEIRNVTDNMEFSLARLQAVKAALSFAATGENEIDTEDLSFYFNFLKYHSMWSSDELERTDLMDLKPSHPYKGYYGYSKKSIFQVGKGVTAPALSAEAAPVSESMEKELADLVAYCNEIESDVLFMVYPFSMTEERQKTINYTIAFVESHGHEVLNFNTEEMYQELGLNFNADFYNSGHTNVLGAEKCTAYLAEYLKARYELTDWRENGGLEDWEQAWQNYLEHVEPRYAEMVEKAAAITDGAPEDNNNN